MRAMMPFVPSITQLPQPGNSRSITLCMFALLLLLTFSAHTEAQESNQPVLVDDSPVPLKVLVMLVRADFSVQPVPKKTFHISTREAGFEPIIISTNFQGVIDLELPPGHYKIANGSEIEFEGSRYDWNVEFRLIPGTGLALELSNDNAIIMPTEPSTDHFSDAPLMNEGALFRKHKNSVFKVISESGHGTGFLVDKHGLIITNHHVISGSEYLAVKLTSGRKFLAALVASDSTNDVAVLRVHPDALDGINPLVLADDRVDRPPVSVGERVMAIGSPLTTENILTSGIVSKIEEGAIYSDVSINPGNSGGPLFNSLGEVVGLNTFGLGARIGPGVAGIVRIHIAQPLLDEAIEVAQSSDPPVFRRLPSAGTYRFPPDELKEMALSTRYTPSTYHVEAGKIDVQFITPVVLASLEVEAEMAATAQRDKRNRRKKASTQQYKAGEGFYEWRRYAGDYRPVVRIQAVPEITMTGASTFAVIMLGPNVPKKYRFKTDFDRMELVRDGTVVEPIFPGRVAQVISSQAGLDSMNDVGYFGSYEYPPEAFKPGAVLLLRIWYQGRPAPKQKLLSTSLVWQIWNDFKPYFEALEKEASEK